MAFRLTKDEQATRSQLLSDLQDRWTKLDEAQTVAENKIREVLEVLNVSLMAFQGIVADVESFRDNVAGRLRGEYEEKSERWQEGDTGQEANSFIEEWENASTEPSMSFTQPEFDFSDGETIVDTFENLPIE